MELSKRIKLLKILVYSYVVILSLIGFCQILIGGTLLWDHSDFNAIVKNTFWAPATIILSLGFFAQFLCWFGWHSTSKKNRCYLTLFNVLLIVLVVMQILTCIWAIKLRGKLIPRSISFQTDVSSSFEKFLKDFANDSTHNWHRIQEQWQCCGVTGPTDYELKASIANSCIAKSKDPYQPGTSFIYQRGCSSVLVHTIKKLLIYASLTAFLAATMQFVGLFCSIQLILSLKLNEDEDEVDTSSMSFRQKLGTELKPLSARTRVHRNQKIEDSIPDTIQSI